MIPRFEHRAIPIVLAAVTIDVIGFGIVMPVLPALITELGHMDLESATRVSGWMLAVFAIAQFFAGPIMGNLGDRFGRRPVLMAAMVVGPIPSRRDLSTSRSASSRVQGSARESTAAIAAETAMPG